MNTKPTIKTIFHRAAMTLLVLMFTSMSAWALVPRSGDVWDDATGTLTVNSDPGDYYKGNGEIKGLVISASVTSIGSYAFQECRNLSTVTSLNNVTSIGKHAFDDTPWYEGKHEAAANGLFYIDGILFGYKGDKPTGSITIEDNTRAIAGYAFAECDGLTSVTIPNSVKSIGDEAFCGCTGLTSVTIGNSVTSIGDDAFHGCSGLTSLTIPSSVTSIGEYAFVACIKLTSITIPNSVTSMGRGTFYNCYDLTSVTIGNGLTSIEAQTFYNCKVLSSITIPSSVTSIGNYAFYGCTGLTTIYALRSESPITTLDDDVFKNCDANLAIVVPAAVKSDYETGWSAYSTKIKAGYTVTCAEGITATSNAPIVAKGETVTLGNTKPGYFCGGYELSAGTLDITNTNTFTMPNQNVHVTADFIPNSDITTANSWAELKAAISDGAVIKLDGDDVYYAEVTSISISSGTVTIYGDGHTIDAQRLNARIFEVESGATLTLKNLILKNVTQTGDGGAIYNDEGTLNVANCTFTNNIATTENGGAIYNNKGTLRIVNSRFEKNAKYDRAIYNYGDEDHPFKLTIINTIMIEDRVCVNYEDNERRLDDKGDIDLLTTEFNAVIPEINAEGTAVPISLTGIDTFFSGDVTVNLSNPPSVTESDINVSVANGGGNNSVSLGVNQYLARFKNFISLTEKAFERDDTKPYQQMTFRVVADWATANAGTETDPYVINNKDQLDLLAQRVNNGSPYFGKYFKLGADITYSYAGLGATESNYTAIGYFDEANSINYYFRGIFDGNNKTISGIRIYKAGTADTDSGQGVFGQIVEGGIVKNLILADSHITGHMGIGGIVGYNYGIIENCTSLASVTVSPNGADNNCRNIGGIAGYNEKDYDEGIIRNCISSATINIGDNTNGCKYIGGITGCNWDGHLTGNLAIGVNSSGQDNLGAISGFCYNNSGLTNNYYSGCTVGGTANATGVGCNGADITANDGAVPAVILSETQASMPAMNSGDKVVFRREFKENVSSTICLPFGIDATQAAAAGKFYTFVGVDKSGANWEVIMQETPSSNLVSGDLSANTPYLFIPAATGPVLFNGTATASITPVDQTPDATQYPNAVGWTFKGSYTSLKYGTNLDGNVYGFAANDYDGGSYTVSPGDFVKAMTGATVAPFRCYLTYSGSSHTRGTTASEVLPSKITVRLVGANSNTTGISEMEKMRNEENADWYSLDGRRINGKPSKKGIYIQNGKIVVVR